MLFACRFTLLRGFPNVHSKKGLDKLAERSKSNSGRFPPPIKPAVVSIGEAGQNSGVTAN